MAFITIQELAQAIEEKKIKDGYCKFKIKKGEIVEFIFETKVKEIDEIIKKEDY